MDWRNDRLNIRRHKTDTQFVVPIYAHLRPLLERLSKERRGKRSPAALVFKIKDAKKALGAACKRLKLPPFSQRSLRQQLIMRLWRAGVDKNFIAQWQGHQDGGQLILDTYTQAFGSDDEEYVRGQLAKIGGGSVTGAAEITQSGSKRETNAPSGFMKKRMRKVRPRAHATGDQHESLDELADGGLLHLGVHFVEVADPLLQPSFGDLAVTRSEAGLPPDAAQLLAGVVPTGASMAVQAGNVGHLDVGGRLGDDRSEEGDHERRRQRVKRGVDSPRSSLRPPSCNHFRCWQVGQKHITLPMNTL